MADIIIESHKIPTDLLEYFEPINIDKGAIWQIPTQPFSEAHFAVFPEDLIETPIKAGCPQYICKKCGVAREKIYEHTGGYEICGGKNSITARKIQKVSPTSTLLTGKRKIKEDKGYSDCGCNAGWHAGIVLDPFMGAGTNAVVARKLARDFIGIELQKEYIPMAHKRIMAIPESLFKGT